MWSLLPLPLVLQQTVLEYAVSHAQLLFCILDTLGCRNVREIKRWCFSNCPCLMESCFPGVFYAARLWSKQTGMSDADITAYWRSIRAECQDIWQREQALEPSEFQWTPRLSSDTTFVSSFGFYDDEGDTIDVDDCVVALMALAVLSRQYRLDAASGRWTICADCVHLYAAHYWGASYFPPLQLDFDAVETIWSLLALLSPLFAAVQAKLRKCKNAKRFRHPVLTHAWVPRQDDATSECISLARVFSELQTPVPSARQRVAQLRLVLERAKFSETLHRT